MKKNSNSIAVLKNANTFGADGALLKSLINFGNFNIYAFKRSALDNKNFNYGENFTLIAAPKNNGKIGSLFYRFFAQINLVFRLISEENKNLERRFMVAGSVELAFIMEICSFKSENKYYLFSDLTKYHKNKWTKNLVAILEGYCVKNGWIPCVTSPGFYSGYLQPIVGCKKSYLIHNSVKSEVFDQNNLTQSDLSSFYINKINIIWCGLLRCGKSVEVMVGALNYGGVDFSVNMYGKINSLAKEIVDLIDLNLKISYKGEYSESSLPGIYSGSSFAWCCDWSLGDNSKLLLPNRLYQALYFGVPIICSANTMLGMVVKYYDIGLCIESSSESLVLGIKSVNKNQYDKWKNNINKLKKYSNISDGGWGNIFSGNPVFVDEKICQGDIFSCK